MKSQKHLKIRFPKTGIKYCTGDKNDFQVPNSGFKINLSNGSIT